MITTIQFDEQAIQAGEWLTDELPTAFERFKTDGCLWLKGIFPTDYLNELRACFLQEYKHYFDPVNESFRALMRLANKRLMVPVGIKGAFNNSTLYAHPLIRSFMKQALGNEFKLGGFGVVVSLPGALDQHIHSDHPALFGTMIDDFMPNFAVTMIVPLVDMTEVSGTTRMWKGVISRDITL
jgi:hypothetical protein